MIVRTPGAFTEALSTFRDLQNTVPVPRGVFMVLPESFRVADESAVDNPYLDLDHPADAGQALIQAHTLADRVRACGVEVKLFPGLAETPDAIFPNNVFATAAGRLLIGSMRHPGRRLEAQRRDIRDWFSAQGYQAIDLSVRDCVSELTGPMIIDRARRIGFCGMSERIDEAGLAATHEGLGLNLSFAFDLVQGEYHTNVVMSILAGRACILCPQSFADQRVPQAIAAAFPGRYLEITVAEKNAFAANCIALTDQDLFISQRGADALHPERIRTLESWGFRLHAVELSEIEKAGGSLRCMIAEIF
ncbi:MAG: amidinotransferase [Xanthomonadales bacterium]|nr:amidinotransferase [Xanthomonadales bacterium]